MTINKILLYGQGNGRDHINHIEMKKCVNIEFCSLIKEENALMEKEKNVIRIKDIQEAIQYAKIYKPDLVIISNRSDLSDGATEKFLNEGFKVFRNIKGCC